MVLQLYKTGSEANQFASNPKDEQLSESLEVIDPHVGMRKVGFIKLDHSAIFGVI